MAPIRPTLSVERELQSQGYKLVAGIDEVGRGSLAGPVVACAVILASDDDCPLLLADVRDSKTLTRVQRERAACLIARHATAIGFGWASHAAVDRLGIAPAARQSMARAVRNLAVSPDALLLDAFYLPEVALPQVALPKADAHCLSVAAASIMAKVVRDSFMTAWGRRFPDYGFENHKGYGTARHRDALRRHGPCVLHRMTFAPLCPRER